MKIKPSLLAVEPHDLNASPEPPAPLGFQASNEISPLDEQAISVESAYHLPSAYLHAQPLWLFNIGGFFEFSANAFW